MRKEIKKTTAVIDKQMLDFTEYFSKSIIENPNTPITKLYSDAVRQYGIIDITASTIQGGVINSVGIAYGFTPKLSADIIGIDSTKKLKAIYGTDYGKQLSSVIYDSVESSQQEVYRLIQKNAKAYKTWKTTSKELTKVLDGKLKGYDNIPKHLDDLYRTANNALLSKDSKAIKSALRNSRKQVEKLSDRRALKKSYTATINNIEKAVAKGDNILLNKALNSYITAKNQSLTERTVITEQARAYNQGVFDDFYDDDVVTGYNVVLSPQHPRYDICDVLADQNPYTKEAVPDMPPHPNSWTTIQPYTGDKKTNQYNPQKAAREAKKNGLSQSSQNAVREKETIKRVPADENEINKAMK